jgi:hypothetical protein
MHSNTQQSLKRETEALLRRRLGIPDDAEQVILLAESSHWDPNWLRTSKEYYRQFVGPNLDRAIDELVREPRRVYSVECVFFLRMYWDQRPAQRDTIRTLVNEGRLRLTSSGVTTADTLLPDAEAILRDWLIGQEWLRAGGMTQEPRLAYFADSFGCTPALPSLLKAAGFDMTAITRIDGMFFPGCDLEPASNFPRAGSSADRLLNQERTLDFVWRGPDGAEVLCHWNAHTYGQGDLLAHRGLTRIYLFPVAVADRSDRNVARRIKQFVAQLLPYSRTPYLFCPIGFDFVAPIRDLVALLDRYNRLHFPTTGVWAVNAGLDDYLALVDCHRHVLPVLALDPNPYWTGFYTSRPTLKERCYYLVDQLLLAERLALLPENSDSQEGIAAELEDAWWTAAVANHHDFITGTSPDRVVEEEQEPWLEQATAEVSAAITRLASAVHPAPTRQPKEAPAEMPEWDWRDGRLQVRTPRYAMELDEEAGGGILRAWCPATQRPLLSNVSNDVVCYRDTGGLWRMGHEFRGGAFREIARASERAARLEIQEGDNELEVTCETAFDGEVVRRRLWFRNDSPAIRMQVEGRAAAHRTLTVRFRTAVHSTRLVMDQAGGVAIRPPYKIYQPTFWPVQHFVYIEGDAGDGGTAVGLRRPGALWYQPDGSLEVIALRNATRERAFGFLPLPATPATGHERSAHTFDYVIWFTPAGDWRRHNIAGAVRHMFHGPWSGAGPEAPGRATESIVRANRPDVAVTAIKPASRGDGLVVRLLALAAPGLPVALACPGRSVREAYLCDTRERDVVQLEVRAGEVHLTMPGTIATVRLLV